MQPQCPKREGLNSLCLSAVQQGSHSQSESLATLGPHVQRWQILATSLREQCMVHCSESLVTAGNTNTQAGKVTKTMQVGNVCPIHWSFLALNLGP